MDGFTELFPADESVKVAVDAFLSQCGRPIMQRYPFGNPVSIETTHLPILSSCPYYVADKSDGVRVCVILCRAGSTCYSILLERTGKVYGFPLTADSAFFDGTVLDAELVKDKDNKFRILVFDSCALAGLKSVEYMKLSDRLELLRSSLVHVEINLAAWSMSVKTMFSLTDNPADITAHMANLPYATDGYILTPENEPTCQPGTAPRILKIKECHTIDFVWSSKMLWFGDQKELFPVTSIPLLFDATQLRLVKNGTVVEMSPQKDKDGHVVMLHYIEDRADKDTPNSYFTVHRTLQSIADDVTLDVVLRSVRS
jgi:hypothetical protein